MTVFVLRIDDVVPEFPWRKFRAIEETLIEFNIRPIVGVVPDNADAKLRYDPALADFWDLIREWRRRGWTVAQHGHRHSYTSTGRDFLRRGRKSEFVGHSYANQHSMLAAGKAIMLREKVWDGVFMAPSHSFDHVTLTALRDLDFRVVTDGWGVYPYTAEGMAFLPQMFATPRNFGFGVYTICLHIGSLSELQLAETVAWIRELAPQFVSLDEALRTPAPPMISAMARLLSSRLLPPYWRLSEFLRN